jgi:ABC-type sugar transport system ATPase subunit
MRPEPISTATTSRGAPAARLVLRGVSKAFAGVRALDDVSFDVRAGEVHALVGENGAGKSTLVKILAGAYLPDSGEIVVEDHVHAALNPRRSQQLGIAVIHQELNLLPDMSVLDNVFIGRELRRRSGSLDRAAMRRLAEATLGRLAVRLDLDAPVSDLSVAQRQLVEIAKSLVFDAKVIVMDEPSAVLAGRELDQLFAVVHALRDQGVSVVYISHRLVEIFSLADRVTVLKDGQVVGTRDLAGLGSDDIVRMMVGRDLHEAPRPMPAADAPVLLEVRGLVVRHGARPIDFSLRAGEVVGVAGLVGSGRSSLARTLAGLRTPLAGEVLRRGRRVRLTSPRSAIGHGVALVPEDRRGEGLLLPVNVGRNISLPSLSKVSTAGVVSPARERDLAAAGIREFDVRPPDQRVQVQFLSGGNQQKVVLAKWLLTDPPPEVVLLDEPTRGVDVAAKSEVHQLVAALAEHGAGILMVSSELPEILALSSRVLVMRDGAVVGELASAEATEEAVIRLAVSPEPDSDDGEDRG